MLPVPLGSALSQLDLPVKPIILTAEEQSRLTWMDLPTSTTSSEERVAALTDEVARLEAAVALHHEGRPATVSAMAMTAATLRAREELGIAQHTHELCLERDAIARALNRPPGCWCLGLGGKGVPTANDDGSERIWTTPCEHCPEGQTVIAIRARMDAEWEAQKAEEAAETAEREYQRRLADSRIPWDMEGWDFASLLEFAPEREGSVRFLRGWAALNRFPVENGARRGLGIFLTGRRGVAKTSLAVSTLKYWVAQGGWGRFVVPVEYFDALRASFHSDDPLVLEEAARLERDVRSAQLLVLDDLGAERTSPFVAERIFRIVNARMNERQPMIITSNHTLEETVQRICSHSQRSAVEGERLYSRLRKMCNIVTIRSDEDLRLRGSTHAGEDV